ncbi:MAG: ABC transporter substrate-binding protein [Sphaerochaetaceae bacterium]|nr:ABC transporter substrate-binding protein [Sphaerochaetaceae bacterium]
MKKKLIVFSFVLLICFCAFSQSIDETQTHYLTYNDSYSHKTTFESYPERIISLTPNITETLYALNAGDKVVARSNYCNFPTECLDKPSIGDLTNPSIEDIVALKPDLIIAGSIVTEQTVSVLRELGLKVVVINKESSIEGTYQMIEDVGFLVNQDLKAQEIIKEMKTSISETQSKIKNLEKVSCYYCVSFGDWGDYCATGDTYINDLIYLAGGINIAEDATSWAINREFLLKQDPEKVILPSYEFSNFESDKQKFINQEPYSNLSASKNEEIFTVEGDIFERQSPRNSEAILDLAKILHPESF